MKKVVVVGAGYAGVLTAKKLAKKFKNDSNVSITIIDKNPYHTMLTELHEVAAGRVAEESIRLNLKKIFAKRQVEVVLDTVTSIDFEKKSVVGEAGQYPYDYVVLAAGSQPTYFGVEGAREHAFKLWSYDDAILLRDHIENCFYEASREKDEQKKKELLTFYVVGAGFTGVEMIGELAEYVPVLSQRYHINPEEVTMVNVDVLPKAVPILPDKLSKKVENRLEKMGVTLKYGYGVVAITEDSIRYKKDDEIFEAKTKTAVWAAGIESADLTNGVAKELPSQGRGRIEVNDYLNTPTRPEVYVVGDNMMFVNKEDNRPVPQMVENCEQSSSIAAHNLAIDLGKSGEKKIYEPKFHGVMVCVGGRYGVAHVGPSKHLFSLPSFLAMFAKHFINMIYYLQVLGWNKIFSYMKHEFFTVRHDRSFVGGHFSNKTPSFLLVLLRMWLGAVWVFEGLHKVVEGWMEKPMLEGFFSGASGWFDSIVNSQEVSRVINVVASASPVGTDAMGAATVAAEGTSGAGVALMNWDILGLIRIIFVSGKPLGSATLADYAIKLDIPIMNWFVDTVILSSDGMQLFMQASIVIIEILIGLALIGGLFATPSAGVSLILQFMFVCTTGLYLSTLWMVFAGIAVLIGSGRIFGFDYYVMLPLKKAWAKIPFMKKWYLYHD